jgi:hypothetical protein
VPRVLAELLGVQTAWADTGVASWATQAAVDNAGGLPEFQTLLRAFDARSRSIQRNKRRLGASCW